MTVCIAAVCTLSKAPVIVAASDRMITSGDIEFEQPQPKVFTVGPHAVSLISGDVSAQAAIAFRAHRRISEEGIADVPGMVRVYGQTFGAYRREAAEAEVLTPLGLTAETLLQRENGMTPALVRRLIDQLQEHRFRVSDIGQAIVAGVDDRGAHLYLVGGAGHPVDMLSIGFVGIGGGQWHAESQLMFRRYVKDWDFARALFLIYAAKRRAEVAPGVGKETDMLIILSNPKQIILLPDTHEFIQGIKNIYDHLEHGEGTARDAGNAEVQEYVEKILSQKPEETPPAMGPTDKPT